MLAVQSPFAGGSHDTFAKPARKPLQSRNSNVLNSTVFKRDDASKPVTQAIDIAIKDNPKMNQEMAEKDYWNKENINPMLMEGLDLSLGAELIEMRKRVERLKSDKEETEKRLKERDSMFEVWKENISKQGEEQRKLEVAVDRLFRINGFRSLTRNVPVRSLREKEASLSNLKWGGDDREESVGEKEFRRESGSG